MSKPLLDRQVSLIHHLTSADAIFGSGRGGELDQALRGIDPRLLHLEARFSHDKRMEKIAAAFPRTLALLGTGREAVIAAFAASCPPADISRIENARQFHGFLAACWQREPPVPPYLPDVAALELAFANSRAAADSHASAEDAGAGIRRKAGVVLLRTTYDIRSIFEDGAGHELPVMNETALAIAAPDISGEPVIFDLTAEVFALLAALDQWTDTAAFEDSPDVNALIDKLAEMRLVEMRP
jgi:hypothetical protein